MPGMTALQRICGLLDREEIDSGRFMALLTRQMSHEIGCSRAAIRMLIDTANGPILHAIAMHDLAQRVSVAVPDMVSDDPKPYFAALLQDGCVVAPDVSRHPATLPFVSGYFTTEKVRSLLDVGFSVNGTLYGSFSCEQVGTSQAWTPQQLALLRQIASRVSLTLMHAVTAQVDTAPGALWEPSTPNRLMTMPMPLSLGDDDTASCGEHAAT